MDTFEDVDLGIPDHSIKGEPYGNPNASGLFSSLVDDAELRGSETRRLGAKQTRVPSEEAYQKAFLPFHTATGTSYPCTQRDLDVHNTGAFHEPNNSPFLSPMEATREVLLRNHVTRRASPIELVAIDNLKTTVNAVEKHMDFGPDLFIKSFADLDLIFSGGHLRDNVRVRCVKASKYAGSSALLETVGVTFALREHGKSLITLNADYFLRNNREDDPLRHIYCTLLHEMCHAYQKVRCGPGRVKRRGHDDFFGTLITVVHQRAMRVLGMPAINKYEPYIQCHFLPGEQTATGMAMGWAMGVLWDLDDGVE